MRRCTEHVRRSRTPNGLRQPPLQQRQPARLLIADDDPSFRRCSACRSAQVRGRGLAATRGGDRRGTGPQPDAALIDVVMPKGGGLNAVQGIQRVRQHAIVVLSGHRSNGLVRELMQAGAIEYRHKGVPAQVLVEALTESIKVHIASAANPRRDPFLYCVGLNRRSHADPRKRPELRGFREPATAQLALSAWSPAKPAA